MFWNKKKEVKKIELENGASAEIDDKTVRITQAGESSGKSALPLLRTIAKQNGLPIYKDIPKHAYESDFIKYKDKCPRCNTPTVQMNSNFAYATQEASRLMSLPAGHFCSECPTVIIDDDLMRQGLNPKYQYGGVYSIESGYSDEPTLFETFNGEKPTFILDETQTEVGGIFQSVNLLSDGVDYVVPPGSPLWEKMNGQKKRTIKPRRRNMSIKKSKRRNKKK